MSDAKCNLIVDSCCDLPYQLIEKPNVSLIQFPYFFGYEETLDDLFKTVEPHDFYERMRNGAQPTTAGATYAMLKDRFEEAIESGLPSVYLSFSSGLSGHYEQVIRVHDQVMSEHPGAELYIVDTHLASTGEALLIFEALRLQEQGMSAKELAEWAKEAQYFVNVYFMVDDLESLRRGGRIPSSVAFAGSKLDVKPLLLIAIDGTLSIKGIARGRKKGIKQLADLYVDRFDASMGAGYVAVGNADALKDMKRLEDEIAKASATSPLFIEGSIGPVIGSHVGPGMVSIAFWGPDKRAEVSVADRIARKVKGE